MTTFSRLAAEGALFYSDGYRTKKSELSTEGYRILRVADVQHGWIALDGTDHVDRRYQPQIGRKIAQVGDLLLTTKGTIGRVAVVDDLAGQDMVYSPQLCFFRTLETDRLDPSYLRYWFSSADAQRQIKMYSGNTDMAPYLSLRDIGALQISLPDPQHQRAIATVLGALDDKIAANRRAVGSINALADAYVSREIDASQLKEPLHRLAAFHNRRRVPLSKRERSERAGAVPYYGATGVMDWVDEPLFNAPLVLVGEDGTVVTETGNAVVQYIWGPAWVNNHAHVLTGTEVSTQLLRHLVARTRVAQSVTGAVQPKLSMGNLRSVELVIPEHDRLAHLEELVASLTAREVAALDENERLAATRDELLPLLMSGRITVQDAEQRVEQEV